MALQVGNLKHPRLHPEPHVLSLSPHNRPSGWFPVQPRFTPKLPPDFPGSWFPAQCCPLPHCVPRSLYVTRESRFLPFAAPAGPDFMTACTALRRARWVVAVDDGSRDA